MWESPIIRISNKEFSQLLAEAITDRPDQFTPDELKGLEELKTVVDGQIEQGVTNTYISRELADKLGFKK